jgi:hypothetical protein
MSPRAQSLKKGVSLRLPGGIADRALGISDVRSGAIVWNDGWPFRGEKSSNGALEKLIKGCHPQNAASAAKPFGRHRSPPGKFR